MKKNKAVYCLLAKFCCAIIIGCTKEDSPQNQVELFYTEVYVNYLEDETLENFNRRRMPLLYYTFKFIVSPTMPEKDKTVFLQFLGNSNCVLNTKYGDFIFFKLKLHSSDEEDTLTYLNAIDFKSLEMRYDSKKFKHMRNFMVAIIKDKDSKMGFYSKEIRKYLPVLASLFEFEIKRSRHFQINYLPISESGEID